MAAIFSRSLHQIWRHSGSAVLEPSASWARFAAMRSKVTSSREINVNAAKEGKTDPRQIKSDKFRPLSPKSSPSTVFSFPPRSAPVHTSKPPPPPPPPPLSSSVAPQTTAVVACSSCNCSHGHRCTDTREIALTTVIWCVVLGLLWWSRNGRFMHIAPAPGYPDTCDGGFGCAYHNPES